METREYKEEAIIDLLLSTIAGEIGSVSFANVMEFQSDIISKKSVLREMIFKSER